MIDSSVSKRISMLRTVLILFVVLLHIGTPAIGKLDTSDAFQLVMFFLQDELSRFAVPTLTMISGYLLFATGLDMKPRSLYKKKARTLLGPFFFFNIVYYAVQYATEYFTGWAPLHVLVNQPAAVHVNFVFNYAGFPLNAPLHFLRDLIVLTVLAPVFGHFMRNRPLLGLMLVTGFFMSNMDGHLVNRNTMAVLFYIGGLAASRHWNVKRFDHLAIPALGLLLTACAAMMYFHIENHVYLYLVAPFTVWPAASLLMNTKPGYWAAKYSKYSFFLFLIHMPMIHAVEYVSANYGPGKLVGQSIVWTFLFIVAVVPVIHRAAMYIMPQAFSFMTGGRASKERSARMREPAGVALANG